jgi:hypothetical protein
MDVTVNSARLNKAVSNKLTAGELLITYLSCASDTQRRSRVERIRSEDSTVRPVINLTGNCWRSVTAGAMVLCKGSVVFRELLTDALRAFTSTTLTNWIILPLEDALHLPSLACPATMCAFPDLPPLRIGLDRVRHLRHVCHMWTKSPADGK